MNTISTFEYHLKHNFSSFYVILCVFVVVGFQNVDYFFVVVEKHEQTHKWTRTYNIFYVFSFFDNKHNWNAFYYLKSFSKIIEITIDCGGKTLMILKLRSLNHKHHGSESQFLFYEFLCFISMSNEPIHRLSNAYWFMYSFMLTIA